MFTLSDFQPIVLFGLLLGLNGVILVAYIVAIPANEIVIPTILMLTVLVTGVAGYGSGAGVMFEMESGMQTKALLVAGGWTLLTAVNLMLFSLIHNPCSTTIYTIYKETGSRKWTAVAALLPLAALAWRPPSIATRPFTTTSRIPSGARLGPS